MIFHVTSLIFVLVFASQFATAKEYNKSTGLPAEQRVKVDKVIAKSKIQGKRVKDEVEGDIVYEDGVTNTGCGKLSIGNVKQPKYGKKVEKVDRDIIITGDVINVATGCNRAKQ